MGVITYLYIFFFMNYGTKAHIRFLDYWSQGARSVLSEHIFMLIEVPLFANLEDPTNTFLRCFLNCSHSARVVLSTSLSVVTLRPVWLWARMKVFRTSFYVPASLERNSHVRIGRDVDATSFLRPRRITTSGKLSYGPKVWRLLNVRGRLAEWVDLKKTIYR